MDAVSALDGVQTVGAMSGGNSMVSMMGSDAAVDNTTFTYYVLLTDEGARRGSEIQEQITDATASLPCEVTVNANGMMDMSALSGSGIEVDLYGSDLNDLNTAAGQVVDLLNSVDGIANASDGQENGDEEINISIDKDKAMRMGQTDHRYHRHHTESQRHQLHRDHRGQDRNAGSGQPVQHGI